MPTYFGSTAVIHPLLASGSITTLILLNLLLLNCSGLQIGEALQLQLDVQSRLHEQLEVNISILFSNGFCFYITSYSIFLLGYLTWIRLWIYWYTPICRDVEIFIIEEK